MTLSLILGEEHFVADQMDTKAEVTLQSRTMALQLLPST